MKRHRHEPDQESSCGLPSLEHQSSPLIVSIESDLRTRSHYGASVRESQLPELGPVTSLVTGEGFRNDPGGAQTPRAKERCPPLKVGRLNHFLGPVVVHRVQGIFEGSKNTDRPLAHTLAQKKREIGSKIASNFLGQKNNTNMRTQLF